VRDPCAEQTVELKGCVCVCVSKYAVYRASQASFLWPENFKVSTHCSRTSLKHPGELSLPEGLTIIINLVLLCVMAVVFTEGRTAIRHCETRGRGKEETAEGRADGGRGGE